MINAENIGKYEALLYFIFAESSNKFIDFEFISSEFKLSQKSIQRETIKFTTHIDKGLKLAVVNVPNIEKGESVDILTWNVRIIQ